jgi:protoporphyrinogen/coproporphyrinogen III oxidase
MSVSVLGGGIGGLSAAYYLSLSQNISQQIKLYEASARFGGWIYSKKIRDGIVFETGPRSLRPVGEVGLTSLDLIEKLGMKSDVLPVHKTHVAAKNRMIFAKDQLCKLPNSFGMVLKTIPPFSKPLMFAGLKDLFTGRSKTRLEDETIYDFFARRFGTEVAKYVISPVICGICAGWY